MFIVLSVIVWLSSVPPFCLVVVENNFQWCRFCILSTFHLCLFSHLSVFLPSCAGCVIFPSYLIDFVPPFVPCDSEFYLLFQLAHFQQLQVNLRYCFLLSFHSSLTEILRYCLSHNSLLSTLHEILLFTRLRQYLPLLYIQLDYSGYIMFNFIFSLSAYMFSTYNACISAHYYH